MKNRLNDDSVGALLQVLAGASRARQVVLSLRRWGYDNLSVTSGALQKFESFFA